MTAAYISEQMTQTTPVKSILRLLAMNLFRVLHGGLTFVDPCDLGGSEC